MNKEFEWDDFNKQIYRSINTKKAITSTEQATLCPIKSELEKIFRDRTNSKINLADIPLSREDLQILYSLLMARKGINDSHNIISISLRNTGLTVEKLDVLRDIFAACSECCVLDVSENELGGEGAKKILELIVNTKIRDINLSRINARNLDTVAITEFINQNQYINRINFTNECLEKDLQDLSTKLYKSGKQIEIVGSMTINNFLQPNTKKRKIEKLSSDSVKKEFIANKKNDSQQFINDKSIVKCRRVITEERAEKILQFDNYQPIAEQFNNGELDTRYRTDCREFKTVSTKSFFDNRFLLYNVNEFLDGYFICEGPDPEESDSFDRFCNILLPEQSAMGDPLTQIKTILVVGSPEDGEKYYDYFTRGQISAQGYTITARQEVQEPHIKGYELTIEKDNRSKKLQLINIGGRLLETGFYLDPLDKGFLYNLALTLNPKTVLVHCDTGVNFSPCILFSFYLFRHFHQIFVGSTEDITKNILDKLNELRKINAGLINTRELLEKSVKLALDYMDFHCQNIMENKLSVRIHDNVETKSIALIGNLTKAKDSFNYIKSKLQNRGIDVSIINLSYESGPDAEFDADQILEINHYFKGDEEILTNLLEASTKRMLNQMVKMNETHALLICDADVPSSVVNDILKLDYQIPTIYFSRFSKQESVPDFTNKNIFIVYDEDKLHESNKAYFEEKCDYAASAVYGLLYGNNSLKKSLAKSAPQFESKNNVVFWSPLKCYQMDFAKNCEQYLTDLGYDFEKFLTNNKKVHQKITTHLEDQNVSFIIEMPEIIVTNNYTGQCQYVNNPIQHSKPMHYVIVFGGIDFVESKDKFANRESYQVNNRIISESTDTILITKGIIDRINHLQSGGNKVDVLIPLEGMSKYDNNDWKKEVRFNTIKNLLLSGVDQTKVGIHQLKYHINDKIFVIRMMEIVNRGNQLKNETKQSYNGVFFPESKRQNISQNTNIESDFSARLT